MKVDNPLYAYRRHLERCAYFGPGGRDIRLDKCNCPFHIDGKHNGKRVRGSLKTRNRQIADKKVAAMANRLNEEYAAELDGTRSAPAARQIPSIAQAAEFFLGSYGIIDKTGKHPGDLKYSSWRKYKNSLCHFCKFCKSKRIERLERISTIEIEQYRQTRKIGQRTWKTELQTLRTFFGYCTRKKWIASNCAAEMKGPRNLTPNDDVPYTQEDEIRIISACDKIGGGRYLRVESVYERLRAKAIILVLRHTALRVSDVIKLRKDAVSWDRDNWQIRVRTTKTGEPVQLPIPNDLKQALDLLPAPRNSPRDCPYYFWNGVSSERAVIGTAERTLSRVFKLSGVQKAHAHRFRHTLATRLLENGATYEIVADILGNTPEVVRKHYAKWSKGRQENIDRLMMGHFQTVPNANQVTNQSREKNVPVN